MDGQEATLDVMTEEIFLYTKKSLIHVSRTQNNIHAINSVLKILSHNISLLAWAMMYFIHTVFILNAHSLLVHFKLISYY